MIERVFERGCRRGGDSVLSVPSHMIVEFGLFVCLPFLTFFASMEFNI
jgi:hypothetical protein